MNKQLLTALAIVVLLALGYFAVRAMTAPKAETLTFPTVPDLRGCPDSYRLTEVATLYLLSNSLPQGYQRHLARGDEKEGGHRAPLALSGYT